MAQYKYLDYTGLQVLVDAIKAKFTALGLDANGKVQWGSISGIPPTFAPSAHTHSYNDLTGSGATANQVIASTGVANKWELKTLGSNAFNSTPIPTKYAGSSGEGGAADSANKLNTDAGSDTKPVYFSGGIPVAVKDELATKDSVDGLSARVDGLVAASDAMVFKGTLGTGGTVTALPDTHSAGDTYKVATAGTYAGVACNVGDLIICITDGKSANNSHWTRIQIDNISLVGGQNSTGIVKNGSSVTNASGYTAVPIIGGVPYYKDTTYTADTAWLTLSNGQFSIATEKQTAIANGEIAYSWGNHSNAGYASGQSVLDLTSVVDGKAPLASPALTGTPTAPTATAGTSTTQIATTAFVGTAVSNGVSGLAPLASPEFTGIPKAPTAAAGTNTTQIATTAFVGTAVSNAIGGLDSTVEAPISTPENATTGSVAFLSKITITDGKIASGSCTSNTMAPITKTEIEALW